MHNFKLTLEYDGTDFVGWQYQENGRSVQREVEKAIKQILAEDSRIVGAGRTDAGVHARGQVAHVHLNNDIEGEALMRSLNGVLPSDIAVLSVQAVSQDFHARYSAKSRKYRYYISSRPSALMRLYSWSPGYKLDVDIMNRCAGQVVGEHDFTSFCKSEAGAEHYRCVVQLAEWKKSNSMLEFDICANRFLHGMVRALVGTMVDVGRGYRTLDEFQMIMLAKDRQMAGMSAPARGLFLEEVIY